MQCFKSTLTKRVLNTLQSLMTILLPLGAQKKIKIRPGRISSRLDMREIRLLAPWDAGGTIMNFRRFRGAAAMGRARGLAESVRETQSGGKQGRNPAPQRTPDLVLADAICCPGVG